MLGRIGIAEVIIILIMLAIFIGIGFTVYKLIKSAVRSGQAEANESSKKE